MLTVILTMRGASIGFAISVMRRPPHLGAVSKADDECVIDDGPEALELNSLLMLDRLMTMSSTFANSPT